MNWLDVLVAVVVVLGAFRGLRRGLIREGMAFLGLAAGMALAHLYHRGLAQLARPFIGGGSWVLGLSYLAIVLGVLGASTVLTVAILRLMKLLTVSWLNRIGGVLFGAAQGALVAAILMFLMVKYPLAGLENGVAESASAAVLLESFLPGVVDLLPPELAGVAGFFETPPLN